MNKLLVVSLLSIFGSTQVLAENMPGFTVKVMCQARSITGGHPKNATSLTLGYWQNREQNMYIFEKDQLRVGLHATNVVPNTNGQLKADLLARDTDSGQMMNYGQVEIRFDSTGAGKGFLHSNYQSSEPYVLGSHELTNCRLNRR
jgi:hypothetical protein